MRKDEQKGRERAGEWRGRQGLQAGWGTGGERHNASRKESPQTVRCLCRAAQGQRSWLLPRGTARGQRVSEWRRRWACSGPRPQEAGHVPTKNCAPSPHRPQGLCPDMGLDDPSHRPCPRSIRKSRGMNCLEGSSLMAGIRGPFMVRVRGQPESSRRGSVCGQREEAWGLGQRGACGRVANGDLPWPALRPPRPSRPAACPAAAWHRSAPRAPPPAPSPALNESRLAALAVCGCGTEGRGAQVTPLSLPQPGVLEQRGARHEAGASSTGALDLSFHICKMG